LNEVPRNDVDAVDFVVKQVNKSLELLVPTARELLAEYQSSGCCTETANTDNLPIFLSCLSLDQYHAAEERFTQELVSFTKKQFFEVSCGSLFGCFIT